MFVCALVKLSARRERNAKKNQTENTRNYLFILISLQRSAVVVVGFVRWWCWRFIVAGRVGNRTHLVF